MDGVATQIRRASIIKHAALHGIVRRVAGDVCGLSTNAGRGAPRAATCDLQGRMRCVQATRRDQKILFSNASNFAARCTWARAQGLLAQGGDSEAIAWAAG